VRFTQKPIDWREREMMVKTSDKPLEYEEPRPPHTLVRGSETNNSLKWFVERLRFDLPNHGRWAVYTRVARGSLTAAYRSYTGIEWCERANGDGTNTFFARVKPPESLI
jgi:hypothetical protein